MSRRARWTGASPEAATRTPGPSPQEQEGRAAPPSRRAVLFGGAAALGTGLVGVSGAAAHAAGRAAGATAADVGAHATSPTAPPYAFYWFPDRVPAGQPPAGVVWRGLLDWDPDTDPDVPFNTATVPLARRVAPCPAHPQARVDQARVESLAAFGTTSQNPSQGVPTASTYTPTAWTYVEELVFWGGSSGEGLILAPTAPVTDAAHRAGVPVLGNIYLPPVAYGGDLAWTRDLVQKSSSGRYPVADQLVLAARRLGFDGWFVNAETDGGDPALAGAVEGFLTQLQEATDLRTTWYDAMTETGRVDWQGELDDLDDAFFQQGAARRSDAMFLDFRWDAASIARSDAHAAALHRSRYELYAGVDVQARGTATPVDWQALFPAGQPDRASLGLYRPDWTFASLPPGAALEDFHAREHAFWVGPHEGPADATGQVWPGVAAHIAERTSITTLPFTSAFGTGHGRRYAVDGVVVSEQGWSHLGLQDVQPQRQWVQPGGSGACEDLRPRLDFDVAYQAGESLALDVATTARELVLFLLDVPIGPHTVVDLVHDGGTGRPAGTGGVELEVVVRTAPAGAPDRADGPWERLPVTPGGRTPSGWVRSRARLSPVAGRRLREVGVRVRGQGPGTWHLGQLTVADRPRPAVPAPVTGLRVQARGTTAGTAAASWVRLLWDRPAGAHHVELYARHRGERWYLGATASGAFYVADLAHPRTGSLPDAIEAVAVSEQYVRSAPSSLRLR